MKKYNFIFQQALKNIILAVIVIAIFTPVGYAAKPTTLQPVSNLTVVDANGKKVGDVIGFSGNNPVVAFKIQSTIVVLTVTADHYSVIKFSSFGVLLPQKFSYKPFQARLTNLPALSKL